MTVLWTVLLAVLLEGVTGCSSPQTSWAQITDVPRTPLTGEHFPGAARLLAGFDRQDPAAADGIKERALFGLELDERGKVQRWLLLVEASEPPVPTRIIRQQLKAPGGSFTYESRTRPLRVRLFDADARKLGESTVVVPWDFLCVGFVSSCELAEHLLVTQLTEVDYRGQRLTRAQAARRMYGGFATLTAFVRIVEKNKLLSSVLWKVVDRPSILSVLFHGGVTLSINAELTSAAPLPITDPIQSQNDGLGPEFAQLPGYRVAMQLSANDTPALNAIMWVTEPQSPYRLCGGILVLEGLRPSEPRVRFRMQLLAARRLP